MDVIFWSGGITRNKTFIRYIGPYKIAHWVRKHGYQAQVIDFTDIFSKDQLSAATRKFITNDTMVLAISTTSISNNYYDYKNGKKSRFPESFVEVIRELKIDYPNLKIILGGYMSDKITGHNLVDATVMSYTEASEDIFLEYLDYLKGRGPSPIGSLVFPSFGNKNTKHRMLYNKARNPKYSIETDDFKFVKQDHILPNEPLPMDVSRGCIFACKFCQYPHLGKKKLDYIRGMSYIKDEMSYNYEMFGATKYYMLDDTFNDTEYKMEEFYKMTQELPFDINYSAYLRADLINRFPSMIDYLKESGLFGAYHGIESLHPIASKLVGKAWSGTDAREYIPELFHKHWNAEIPMHLNFICGITSDTRESIISSANWFIENKLHSIKFTNLGLYGPGNDASRYTVQSEFDKNAEKYGFTFHGEDDNGVMAWSNDNWTNESCKDMAAEVMDIVTPHRKAHSWTIPSLMWYGKTKQEILNTTVDNYATRPLLNITNQKVEYYYNSLMSSN